MQKIVLIILTLLLVNGCATTINSTRLTVGSDLTLGHGVVAVKVVNNTNQLAPLHPKWTEIIAFRIDNGAQLKQAAIDKAKVKAKGKAINEDKVEWNYDVYSLSPLAEGVIDSQVFVGSMPQGDYLIGSLYSFYSDGNMSSWITMPVNFSAGKFDVVENQFSDLGTVVFQPLLSTKERSFWSNNSEQKAYVTRMPNSRSLQGFVTTHYPKLVQRLDFNKKVTWQKDELDSFRLQLSELSRENAFADKGIQISGESSKALLAKFGQLKFLGKDNLWKHYDVPTNGRVSAVIRLNDSLVVGSELGGVFIKKDSDKQWQEYSPVSAKEAVMWFGRVNKSIYALTSSRQNYYVYHVKDIKTQWNKVGTFKRKNRKDFFVQNGGLFPVVTQNNQLRIINDNKKFDYEPKASIWKKSKAESLVKMQQLKDGTLIGLEVSQWDGIGDQLVSFDSGDTWVSLSRKLKMFGDNKSDVSLPSVLPNGTIITLGRSMDKSNKDLILISKDNSFADKKSTWSEHHKAKDGCHSMLPSLSQLSTLYFLCDRGEVVSTSDLGATWQVEVDINIAEMQEKYETLLDALKRKNNKKAREVK
jgi:hypothetical protein